MSEGKGAFISVTPLWVPPHSSAKVSIPVGKIEYIQGVEAHKYWETDNWPTTDASKGRWIEIQAHTEIRLAGQKTLCVTDTHEEILAKIKDAEHE